jgi:photosystem II stability/assembly factor-like uncharacterized protein
MKKLFTLIALFILISSKIFSQTGWILTSTGTNKNIHDIYFVNANTGWAVGDTAILKSTNGGVNWFQQNFYYPGVTQFYAVRFINENTGFAGGGYVYDPNFYHFKQYLLKTTNSGNNWILIFQSQNEHSGHINNILPINENLIYITLFGYTEMYYVGDILRSTNGGQNFTGFNLSGGYYSISFINPFTGWATSHRIADISNFNNSKIYKTTNAGFNWSIKLSDSGAYCKYFNDIEFFDENTGYCISAGYHKSLFLKTTDGGEHWDSSVYDNSYYSSLFFLNKNQGWIGGNSSVDSTKFAYTSNGGLSWKNQCKLSSFSPNRIFFIDSLNGWATMDFDSRIYRTTTGGHTFVRNISNEIPFKYKLYQNYPNPFNPKTIIKFDIPPLEGGQGSVTRRGEGMVSLKIYNILGEEIETLIKDNLSPGTYEVKFDGTNLPSGIYYYKLTAGDFSDVKKLMLVK